MRKAGRKKKKPAKEKVVQPQRQEVYQLARTRVVEHVRKALQEERGPMTLIRLALAAQRTCEDFAESVEPSTRGRLACQQGCDFCCYPPVSASVPEVANIVAYISSQLSTEQQQRLTFRVGQVYQQVHPMSGAQREATSVACPYLENGRCSIYPVRPLACRGFNSTSVSACQKAYDEPDKGHAVPSFVPLVASAQGLKEGLAFGLEEAGLAHPLVDLVRASQKLLNNLEHNLECWLDGADVFADCQPFTRNPARGGAG